MTCLFDLLHLKHGHWTWSVLVLIRYSDSVRVGIPCWY